MSTKDILELLALALSAPIAVGIGQYLQNRHAARERRESIFRTLMATRATPIHIDRVRALNLIDVEFYADKSVREAWSAYFELLTEQTPWTEERNRRSIELSTTLVRTIGESLGYQMGTTDLTRRAYIPQGHGDFDSDWFTIRKSFVAMTKGQAAIPIVVANALTPPPAGNPQQTTPALPAPPPESFTSKGSAS